VDSEPEEDEHRPDHQRRSPGNAAVISTELVQEGENVVKDLSRRGFVRRPEVSGPRTGCGAEVLRGGLTGPTAGRCPARPANSIATRPRNASTSSSL
jgi:hypothetical protein